MGPSTTKKPDAPSAIEPRKVPTKEEWDFVDKQLSGTFGDVAMLVDGYDVVLCRRLISKNVLSNVVYIDKTIKAEWLIHHKLSEKKPVVHEVARRFYRKKITSVHKTTDIKRAERDLGKRLAKKWGYHEKFVSYSAHWPSVASLKRHLLKNNHNIEIVKEEFFEK
jgi:hypothetical protein